MDVSGAGLMGEQLYMLLEQLKQLRLLIVCDYDDAALEHAARHPSFDAKCAWTLDLGNVPEAFVANHHRMLTFNKQLQLQIASNEDFHHRDSL